MSKLPRSTAPKYTPVLKAGLLEIQPFVSHLCLMTTFHNIAEEGRLLSDEFFFNNLPRDLDWQILPWFLWRGEIEEGDFLTSELSRVWARVSTARDARDRWEHEGRPTERRVQVSSMITRIDKIEEPSLPRSEDVILLQSYRNKLKVLANALSRFVQAVESEKIELRGLNVAKGNYEFQVISRHILNTKIAFYPSESKILGSVEETTFDPFTPKKRATLYEAIRIYKGRNSADAELKGIPTKLLKRYEMLMCWHECLHLEKDHACYINPSIMKNEAMYPHVKKYTANKHGDWPIPSSPSHYKARDFDGPNIPDLLQRYRALHATDQNAAENVFLEAAKAIVEGESNS